jgi:hypothetical protein
LSLYPCLLVINIFLSDLEVKFTKCRDFTWSVSDCEELVGVTHRR